MDDWQLSTKYGTRLRLYMYKHVGYWEEFEDTKGVNRTRKSKKYRQQNGEEKSGKRTNNDIRFNKLD